MLGPDFLPLPVHRRSALVEHLHAVHPDVALSRLRIARDHARKCDEPSCILRPALQHWEIVQIETILVNIVFARAAGDSLGEEFPHFRQHGQHFDFVEEALRRLYVHELPNAIGNFIQRIHFQRHAHPALGAELINKDRNVVSFGLFKQQCRPAAIALTVAALGNAIRNLSNFKNRINFSCDPFQFARALKRGNPFS